MIELTFTELFIFTLSMAIIFGILFGVGITVMYSIMTKHEETPKTDNSRERKGH